MLGASRGENCERLKTYPLVRLWSRRPRVRVPSLQIAPEIEPFGIHTTVVNPGFFRTELLTKESTNYAQASIEDYADRNAAQRELWERMNGTQGGDPAKLAQALLTIAGMEQPPFRFIGGADALAQAEEKLAERRQQIDAHRGLSSSLAFDQTTA